MTKNKVQRIVAIVLVAVAVVMAIVGGIFLPQRNGETARVTIEELRIPQDDAVQGITYAGMSAQEIDWVKSREDMKDFLESSWLVMDDDEYDD